MAADMEKGELMQQSLKKIGRRVDALKETEAEEVDVDLNDYKVAQRVFEWLDFLTQRAGMQKTSALLDKYSQIGVISSNMHQKLEAYLRGISPPETAGHELTIEEHEKSLELLNAIYDQSRRT